MNIVHLPNDNIGHAILWHPCALQKTLENWYKLFITEITILKSIANKIATTVSKLCFHLVESCYWMFYPISDTCNNFIDFIFDMKISVPKQ